MGDATNSTSQLSSHHTKRLSLAKQSKEQNFVNKKENTKIHKAKEKIITKFKNLRQWIFKNLKILLEISTEDFISSTLLLWNEKIIIMIVALV